MDFFLSQLQTLLVCVSGCYLLAYRLLTHFKLVSRANVIQLAKIGVGLAVFGTSIERFNYSVIAQFFITLFGAALWAFIPDGIVVFSAACWLGTTIGGIVGLGAGMQPDLTIWFDATKDVIALAVAILLVCVETFVSNWEVIVLPVMSATCILRVMGLPEYIICGNSGPVVWYVFSSSFTLFCAWVALAGLSTGLHVYTNKNGDGERVDLNDPHGMQNSLITSLIDREAVGTKDYFDSKFPAIAKLAGDNNDGHPMDGTWTYPSGPSQSGGILENVGPEGLTQNQREILNICDQDEEAKFRVLFGGGLY